jgi:hypothetical protein
MNKPFALLGFAALLALPQSADIPNPIRFEEIAAKSGLRYITANASTGPYFCVGSLIMLYCLVFRFETF